MVAARQPDERRRQEDENGDTDQPVVESRQQPHPGNAERIDQQSQSDGGQDAGRKGQERDADDTADIGEIQACRLVDPVTDRSADEDMEADGIGDAVADEAGEGGQADRDLVGGDAANRHDVVDRHRDEADQGEGDRLPDGGDRGLPDRRADLVEVQRAGDLMDDDEADRHHGRADQGTQHARLQHLLDNAGNPTFHRPVIDRQIRMRHRSKKSVSAIRP